MGPKVAQAAEVVEAMVLAVDDDVAREAMEAKGAEASRRAASPRGVHTAACSAGGGHASAVDVGVAAELTPPLATQPDDGVSRACTTFTSEGAIPATPSPRTAQAAAADKPSMEAAETPQDGSFDHGSPARVKLSSSKSFGLVDIARNAMDVQRDFEATRAAVHKLQSLQRRRRWRVLLSSKIPRIHGPAGMTFYPIFDSPLATQYIGVESPSGKQYRGVACCLAPHDPWRLRLIFTVEHPIYQAVTLAAIIANCTLMAFQGPPGTPDALFDTAHFYIVEVMFTLFFTAEMAMQVLAMGFVGHPHAYLADAWNHLDFAIVVVSWLTVLFPNVDNLTAARALRALRPLRTIKRLPKLKKQVDTIVESVPFLLDVAMLALFILTVWSILGLQLFKGALRYRCYTPDAPEPLDAQFGVCHPPDASDATAQGSCRDGLECRQFGANPRWGLIGFDDIALASVTVFRCITLEGWTEVLYLFETALGSAIVKPFFITLVVFGGYYLLNLFLAVIWHVYSQQHVDESFANTNNSFSRVTANEHAGLDPKNGDGDLANTGAEKVVQIPTQRQPPQSEASFLAFAHQAWPPWWPHCSILQVVTHPAFDGAGTVLILINTGIMMCESHPMDPDFKRFLDNCNVIFTLLFACEMALKLVAHGFFKYWADHYNRFDGFIVITSLVDVASVYVHVGINGSFLRGLRLLRVFRLLRWWHSLQNLLNVFGVIGFRALTWLFCLLGLVLFVFALLGMQMFGMQFRPPNFPLPPRHSFDSITSAMLTVFIVSTGEGWDDVWVDTQRATGGPTILFFFTLIFSSTYLVLKLLTAVVFQAFLSAKHMSHSNTTSASGSTSTTRPTSPSMGSTLNSPPSETSCWPATSRWRGLSVETPRPGSPVQLVSDGQSVLEQGQARTTRSGRLWSLCQPACLVNFLIAERNGYALGWFASEHQFRNVAIRILRFRMEAHPTVSFESAIIACIIVSSLLMAFGSCDVTPGSNLMQALEYMDIIVTWIFVFELVIKVVALGLWECPKNVPPHLALPYLRSTWNRLDAFVVLASVMSEGSGAFRALRVLRVLRPLRLIARFEGLRRVVELFLRAVPKMLDVIAIYIVVTIVYAILGVQLFAGKFGSCDAIARAGEINSGSVRADASDKVGFGGTEVDTPTTRAGCEAANLRWANPPYGDFDNFGHALLRLFEMATLEGWTQLLFAGIDASEIDHAPVRDYNVAQSLYFVLWILLGSLVLLDLFTGTLISTYDEIHKEEDGLALLTEQQFHWTIAMEQFIALRPKVLAKCPSDAGRAWCFQLVQRKQFEQVILMAILLNTALLASDSYNASDRQAAVLSSLNDLCMLVFIMEATAKVAAFGWYGYIAEPWNRFDLIVVAFAIADWFATLLVGNWGASQPAVVRVLRLTRVLRTLRVVRAARGLSMLIGMLLVSFAGLLNILGVYFIILSIYALLAMQLFGRVAHGPYINEYANFCTFPRALLTLFRCATGEDWNGLMDDAQVSPASGQCTDERGDCGTWLAVPFFVSYEIIAMFIVLKMAIALINEAYAAALRRDQHSLRTDDADAFVDAWSKYDEAASGKMNVRHLKALILELKPPLGLDPQRHGTLGVVTAADVSRYVFQMDLCSYRGTPGTSEPESYVTFTETFACLVKDIEGNAGSSGRTRRQRNGELRRSKKWEQILPSPASPIGQRWIRKLREELAVPLSGVPGVAGNAEHANGGDHVGPDSAQATVFNVWSRKMKERQRAEKNLTEARKTLRQSRMHFKDAGCQTHGQASTAML